MYTHLSWSLVSHPPVALLSFLSGWNWLTMGSCWWLDATQPSKSTEFSCPRMTWIKWPQNIKKLSQNIPSQIISISSGHGLSGHALLVLLQWAQLHPLPGGHHDGPPPGADRAHHGAVAGAGGGPVARRGDPGGSLGLQGIQHGHVGQMALGTLGWKIFGASKNYSPLKWKRMKKGLKKWLDMIESCRVYIGRVPYFLKTWVLTVEAKSRNMRLKIKALTMPTMVSSTERRTSGPMPTRWMKLSKKQHPEASGSQNRCFTVWPLQWLITGIVFCDFCALIRNSPFWTIASHSHIRRSTSFTLR